MRFTMRVDMDGAAFEEDGFTEPQPELVRLLKLVTSRIERGSTSGPMLDVNGNRCGTWEIERDLTISEQGRRAIVAAICHDGPMLSPMTCGTCRRTWDDAVVTSVTPVPAGRCPFEADHAEEP